VFKNGKERNPFPSVKTLAARIGIQPRQVRRYFEQLEKEIVIEVQGETIRGLVKRVDRFHESKGRTSNEYDLSNLLHALKLIAQERESLSGNLKTRKPNNKVKEAANELRK
jgi:DNA-binding transcriptional regulator YhcF (GntR family)